MKFLKLLFLITFFSNSLMADEGHSPVGRWKTIDDKTNEVASIMFLWTDEQGKLHGKVEKVITKEGEDPNPVCDKCTDERKNKPLQGMEIMWNFVQEQKNNFDKWVSGKILDPDEGNVYSCELTLHDGGKRLEVRGYIGIPWIGRSQTWIRLD